MVKRGKRGGFPSAKDYQVIFENTGTAIVIVEEDATLSLVNTGFERLVGYRREEVEGKKKWMEFVPRDELKRMKEYHRLRRIDPSVPKTYDFRCVDRWGRTKEVLINVAMIPGTKRSVVSLLDITENKGAERALRESEAKVRALLDAIPDFIFQIGRDGTFRGYKAAKREDLSPPPPLFLGKKLQEVFPSPLARRAMAYIQEALRTKKVQTFEYQLPIRGQERHFEARLVAMDEEEVLAIVRDITERRQVEAAIIRAKREWESTFDTIEEMIFLTDEEGMIRRVNRATARRVGLHPRELIGRRCYEVFRCQREGTEECCLWRIKAKLPLLPCELYLSSFDIWVKSRAYVSYTSQGKIDYVIHIYRDITHEKESERTLAEYKEALNRSFFGITEALSRLIEERDPYTSGHSMGVARLAVAIAK